MRSVRQSISPRNLGKHSASPLTSILTTRTLINWAFLTQITWNY
jgi:hypothetical protein